MAADAESFRLFQTVGGFRRDLCDFSFSFPPQTSFTLQKPGQKMTLKTTQRGLGVAAQFPPG